MSPSKNELKRVKREVKRLRKVFVANKPYSQIEDVVTIIRNGKATTIIN